MVQRTHQFVSIFWAPPDSSCATLPWMLCRRNNVLKVASIGHANAMCPNLQGCYSWHLTYSSNKGIPPVSNHQESVMTVGETHFVRPFPVDLNLSKFPIGQPMILGWMPVIFFQFDQHSGETIRTQNYLSAQFPRVKIIYSKIQQKNPWWQYHGPWPFNPSNLQGAEGSIGFEFLIGSLRFETEDPPHFFMGGLYYGGWP